MKRFNIIFLFVVIVIIISSVSLMACHKDIKPEEPPAPTPEITASDFYSAANQSNNYRYTYKVKSGNTLVYSDTNGAVSNPYKLDIQKASFTSGGNGLTYEDSAFSDVEINELTALNQAVLNAKIVSPSTFLGVEGATNATIKITIQNTTKNLQGIEIYYDVTSSGTTYSISIELNVA